MVSLWYARDGIDIIDVCTTSSLCCCNNSLGNSWIQLSSLWMSKASWFVISCQILYVLCAWWAPLACVNPCLEWPLPRYVTRMKCYRGVHTVLLPFLVLFKWACTYIRTLKYAPGSGYACPLSSAARNYSIYMHPGATTNLVNLFFWKKRFGQNTSMVISLENRVYLIQKT